MRMHTADYAVARCQFVCLSVCHMHTWYCVEMAKGIIKLFSPLGRNTTLVFCTKCYGNIPTVNGSVKYRGQDKISIFDQYLDLSGNDSVLQYWVTVTMEHQ